MNQITHFSNKILEKFTPVKPDEFWFTTSDNIKVQGWIMKPIEYKKGNKYPTILQIHGGRWSNYNYHFNLLFQLDSRCLWLWRNESIKKTISMY